MSLRDQLLAKGLATKKDARKANRDLKKKRKQKQSKREKRSITEAKERQKTASQQAKKLAERQQERRVREVAREADERALRVLQMIQGNRIGHQGRTIFHFKKRCGRKVGRMEVSEKVAWMLRCGEAAIAGYEERGQEVYVVISGKAARRISELDGDSILFLTEETAGISSADEGFLKPTWEASLRPHRLKEST